MDEKRKYKRSKTDLKSEVHFDEGMTYSKSVDVSKGGLFISTPDPLEAGSEVSLSLQIPGEDPVDISGVVRWVRREEDDNNKAGMGIEFLDLSDVEIEKLKKIDNS